MDNRRREYRNDKINPYGFKYLLTSGESKSTLGEYVYNILATNDLTNVVQACYGYDSREDYWEEAPRCFIDNEGIAHLYDRLGGSYSYFSNLTDNIYNNSITHLVCDAKDLIDTIKLETNTTDNQTLRSPFPMLWYDSYINTNTSLAGESFSTLTHLGGNIAFYCNGYLYVAKSFTDEDLNNAINKRLSISFNIVNYYIMSLESKNYYYLLCSENNSSSLSSQPVFFKIDKNTLTITEHIIEATGSLIGDARYIVGGFIYNDQLYIQLVGKLASATYTDLYNFDSGINYRCEGSRITLPFVVWGNNIMWMPTEKIQSYERWHRRFVLYKITLNSDNTFSYTNYSYDTNLYLDLGAYKTDDTTQDEWGAPCIKYLSNGDLVFISGDHGAGHRFFFGGEDNTNVVGLILKKDGSYANIVINNSDFNLLDAVTELQEL